LDSYFGCIFITKKKAAILETSSSMAAFLFGRMHIG